MKHTLKATITLVLFFFLAQLTGLLIVNQYIDHQKTAETQTVAYRPLPYNLERPEVENQSTSFIYVMVSILVGTGLLLLIIKTNKPLFWKMMFFISVLFRAILLGGQVWDCSENRPQCPTMSTFW